MLENEAKTGLLCVSAASSFDASVKVNFDGQEVKGTDFIKILGVTLNKDCSFSTHVTYVGKKLRAKTWCLQKLKNKGMREEDLVEAYKTLIRPMAEYASPV